MHRRMFALGVWGALAALSLSLSAPSAQADGKKKTKTSAAPAAEAVPTTKDPIKLVPEGMKWGMTRAQLESMVDKFVDDDFRPKYKAVGKSAPKIKDLDVEAATQKAAFRRSYIELTPGPTGLDSSPLAGEYTKGNNEALMSHHRGPGVKIWFFFIGGRLWKTIEEVSLIDGGLYGKDMAEAAKKIIDSVGGTVPHDTAAAPDKGQYYEIFDWQDAVTHMRLWDRSGVIVIAREEKSTLSNLGNLRHAAAAADNGVDPSVSAIMRPADDKPKDDAAADKGKGKGKGKK